MPYFREGEGITYDFGFNDVNSSRLDAFSGSVVDAARSGLVGINNRASEDYQAKYGMPAPPASMLATPADAIAYQLDNYKPPKILSKEDAESKVKAAGVKLTVPDKGVSEDYLNLLIERKKDTNARNLAIDRSPDGVVSGTVNVLGALAGSLVDPTNIALAFIPVVGEARYASLLARAGESALARTAVRAGVGAVEGAVGQAVIEPFTALDRLSNQDEYGFGTAAANIGFGALFGTAAHVGFHAIGRASDVFRERFFGDIAEPNAAVRIADRVSPDISEAAVRAKISADAMGADVNIEPILRLDPKVDGRLTPEQLAARDAYAEDFARRAVADVAELKADLPRLMEEGRTEWDSLSRSANTIHEGDLGSVKSAVKESQTGANDRYADHKSSAEADVTLKDNPTISELDTVKAETDELVKQVKQIETERGAEFPEMKAANEAAARAQVYAKATQAAAMCGAKF